MTKHFLLVIFFLSVVINFVNSQSKNTFKGVYYNNLGQQGQAEFAFKQKEAGEKIADGAFKFFIQYQDSLDCDRLTWKSYDGHYKEGQKHGNWNYEYKHFLLHKNISGFNIIIKNEGIAKKLTASFNNGNASGNWNLNIDKIDNGKVTAKIAKGAAAFSEGRMVGKLIYQENSDNTISVNGQFDVSGNLNGIWKLNYSVDNVNFEEIREYQNGFLLQITKANKTTGKSSIVEYNSVKEKLNKLKLNSNDTTITYKIGDLGFDVLFDDGYRTDSEKRQVQLDGNNVISFAMKQFCSESNETFEIKGVNSILPGTTRRFKYFFSAEELAALSNLTSQINDIRPELDSLLTDKVFIINHQKNDSLARAYAYLENADKKIKIIEEKIELINSEMFQYRSRENYFRDGVKGLPQSDTIRYDFGEKKKYFVVNYQTSFNQGDKVILNLNDFTAELINEIEKIKVEVTPELQKLRLEKHNREMEDNILVLMDSVHALYSQTGVFEDALPNYIYSTIFTNKFKNSIQKYSNEANLVEKQQIGSKIIESLETMIAIYPHLSELRDKHQKLDESFSRLAYNPWTGEYDIHERKKRRIYQRGVEELWPYLIAQLKNENTVEGLANRVNELVSLYSRLMELLLKEDTETRKLEQKLRKESNPEKIKRLLEVKSEKN
jgi:hypothetical protein